MNIFEFENYKVFVQEHLKTLPRRGHGQYRRIAELLGIHTTMVTHIFRGDSNLSVEQALKLAEHFVLSEIETEYFITLVQHSRSTNRHSRAFFERQRSALRTRILNLGERLQAKKSLDERDQAIFYSAWYYSGIRLLTAIHDLRSAEAIAELTSLSLPTVARTLEFLVSTGLLRREENGRYVVDEMLTYVGRDSRLVTRHHLNWRLKAIEQLESIADDELVFTNSIALSKNDFLRIREEIVKLLETYKAIGDPSPPEELCFLAIDWRRVRLVDSP
jgi:uncharacterized protein (TIGR02147 family)